MFTLTIRTGNDAMSHPDDIAEALRQVAKKLDVGDTGSRIMDDNGNVVGEWVFQDDRGPTDDHLANGYGMEGGVAYRQYGA